MPLSDDALDEASATGEISSRVGNQLSGSEFRSCKRSNRSWYLALCKFVSTHGRVRDLEDKAYGCTVGADDHQILGRGIAEVLLQGREDVIEEDIDVLLDILRGAVTPRASGSVDLQVVVSCFLVCSRVQVVLRRHVVSDRAVRLVDDPVQNIAQPGHDSVQSNVNTRTIAELAGVEFLVRKFGYARMLVPSVSNAASRILRPRSLPFAVAL